jgi:hypothetical protein
MIPALTPSERAAFIASGVLKPAPEKPKHAPAFIRYRHVQPGRKQTLAMIEAELREQIKRIERKTDWKSSPTLNASHFAWSEALRIVKSHGIISGGKPVGGGE